MKGIYLVLKYVLPIDCCESEDDPAIFVWERNLKLWIAFRLSKDAQRLAFSLPGKFFQLPTKSSNFQQNLPTWQIFDLTRFITIPFSHCVQSIDRHVNRYAFAPTLPWTAN